MKKRITYLIATFFMMFFAGSMLSYQVCQSESVTKLAAADYYQGILDTTTGTQLRRSLYNLMMNTHETYTTYDGLSTSYKTADADPDHPGNVLLFYTGTSRTFNGSFSGTINREHVWPNSKGVGKSGPGSDSHHLRPCDSQLNSTRGNLDFDEVSSTKYAKESGTETQNKLSSSAFEPIDDYKGEVARILFYVGMHYGPESSYNLTIVDTIGNGSGKSIGKLSTLLKWNLEHPVKMTEIRRNEAVQTIQGNRNPFIDHPEYACKIWGDYNDNTRLACANAGQEGGNTENPENAKEIVQADANALLTSYGSLFSNPITSLSNLNSVGKYGSNIKWTSSNTNVLSINATSGAVTIKRADCNQTVRLQATISYQGESQTITFDVVVKHNIVVAEQLPLLKENDGSGDFVEGTYNYVFTAIQKEGSLTLGSATWEHQYQNPGQYSGYGDKGYQMGSSNKPGGGTFVTSDFTDKRVKSVSFNGSTASSGKTTVEISIGDHIIDSFSLTTTATAYTANNTNNYMGDIKIEYNVTQKAAYIKQITIVYEDGSPDEQENTYTSISLENAAMRFGISLTKESILNTLKKEENEVDFEKVKLGVIATSNNVLKEYGYESVLELDVSKYSSRIIKQPLFNYKENVDIYSVSLVLYQMDIYEDFNAVCYMEYQGTCYYALEIQTSYYDIAELNYQKYLSLKEDLQGQNNYHNEYEKVLGMLAEILN